jgi:hypothetical protein
MIGLQWEESSTKIKVAGSDKFADKIKQAITLR